MEKVSIIIISYNTNYRLIDTLESVVHQTYNNLEVIIADDASTDNSIAIYKNWVDINRNKFVNIDFKIISNEVNCGIEKNIYNAIRQSTGDYIKIIADDIMKNNYIDQMVKKYKEISNDKIIWCPNICAFPNTDEDISSTNKYIEKYKYFLSLSHKKQKQEIVNSNWLVAPAVDFFSRKIINKYNLFNLGFNYLEDWPCWIVLSQAGYKFTFYDEVLLEYRVYGQSISRTNNYKSKYWKSYAKLYFKMRLKLLLKYKYYKTFFKEFLRSSYIILLKIFEK